MKWVSHKVISFSLVWLIVGDFIGAVISGFSSIFPDLVEGKDYGSERWMRRHRGISHWLLGWLILLGLVVFVFYLLFGEFPFVLKGNEFLRGSLDLGMKFWLWMSVYFILGCVLHILEDAITGKVPFLRPWKKEFGFRLIRVGGIGEKIFVLFIVFLFFLKMKG